MNKILIVLLFFCFSQQCYAQQENMHSNSELLKNLYSITKAELADKRKNSENNLFSYLEKKIPFFRIKLDNYETFSSHCSSNYEEQEFRYYLYLRDHFNRYENAHKTDMKIRAVFKKIYEDRPHLSPISAELKRNKDAFIKYMANLKIHDQYYILRNITKYSLISENFPDNEVAIEGLQFLMTWQTCEAMRKQAIIARDLISDNSWTNLNDIQSAYNTLFLIIQHSNYFPDLQSDGLKLIKKWAQEGKIKQNSYAYLYDRVSLNQNGFQKFGTQLKGCGLMPLQDKSKVNIWRAELKMESVEKYLSWVPNCAGTKNIEQK